MKGKNTFINCIYYHDVVEDSGNSYMQININLFKEQMQYLIDNGYQTYSFDDLDDNNCVFYADKKVLITFDDGWLSNYSLIFDYMIEHNIKYNIFLTTSKIGIDENYLNWEQVRCMRNSGLVGFGVHTHTHADLSKTSIHDMYNELIISNKVFEKNMGYKSNDFCFPYGTYTKEVLNEIVESGLYKRIYRSDLDFTYLKKNTLIFGRNAISNDEEFDIFKNKIAGHYNIFSALKQLIK